jgi:outer membrane receptor protein involved in Fe transport
MSNETVARRSWMRGWVAVACLSITAYHSVHAQQATAPAPAATPVVTSATSTTSVGDLDEIVINGIRRGDLIMPTTVTSDSAYGMDLGVMDTPRNTTVISKAQLDALNIQNPGGFSYLTSSSYTDASFGQPNVPRIRGQYGDMFFNGMRDSFTLNGYGAPISFNSVDSIDIVKGPASVQAGPGAGVGGAIDITTKMPSLTKSSLSFNLEADTQQKRIAEVDFGGPITSNTAARVSITSNDSGSYYYDMFFHQQAIFAAGLTQFTDKFSVLYTVDFADTQYRENDGVNRVNQDLIDNNTYLTGAPPSDTIVSYLTPYTLTGTTTQLNPRIIIDEPTGNGAHAQHIKAQIIGTYKASDNFTITNNTFYDYLNRYNQVEAYYADSAKNRFTIENKTDFDLKFATGPVNHNIDAGFTYRYAHVWDVQNYVNEPVGVYDLSGNPNSWVFPASEEVGDGNFPYYAAFNHYQYGTPGRYPFLADTSVVSNLEDAAIFFEHRIEVSKQLSVLYGLRADVVQLNEADPFPNLPADYYDTCCFGDDPGLPAREHTGWYGLKNGNISVVYSPIPALSTYLTFNSAQYVLPDDNDGAVNTFGEAPTSQLRQDTTLEELGVKLDLLNKALFISSAIFHQTRAENISIGAANTTAHIQGAEIELNFQPDPHFFATASYSYLHTTLDTASPFYNFPAYVGNNVDGAGNFAVFGQQSFQDPGVPQHLFNVLANYKHPSGFGAQANIQVTGPLYTTQPGYINIAATNAYFGGTLVGPGGIVPLSVVGANGYYSPPQIPWQYTVNGAVFYNWSHYMFKFTVYNLTNQHNLQNDIPYYGNDFLTRLPPRSFDFAFSGKF